MREEQQALDRSVEERLDLLSRWIRVVQHDLNNLIYPGESLVRDCNDSNTPQAVQKFVRQAQTLVEMIDATRASLGSLKKPAGGWGAAPTLVNEWWSDFGRFAAVALSRDAKLKATVAAPTPVAAASRPLLSRLVLSLLLALDAQCEMDAGVLVRLSCGSAGNGDVVIEIRVPRVCPEPLLVPAIAHTLASDAGGHVSFDPTLGDGGAFVAQLPAAVGSGEQRPEGLPSTTLAAPSPNDVHQA